MNKFFGTLINVAVLASTCVAAGAMAQDAYPSKPVRLLVGFPAGGPADIAARILAEAWQTEFKQSFIVENRTGAGGNIASQYVAKAPPDGYVLLVATASLTVNPIMSPNAGYDPQKDFVPIALIANQANAIAIHSALPIKNLAELKALAGTRAMSFATSGVGTSSDLSAKYLFNMTWGSNLNSVPYRGAGPAGMAVASGEPPIGFTTITGVLPLQQEGRVRILAVVNDKRLPALPDVPTLAEQGYPQLNPSWTALFAPAGTPPALIDKLNAAVNTLVTRKDFAEKLNQQVMTAAAPMKPAQLSDYLKSETESWAKIVKAVGTTAN